MTYLAEAYRVLQVPYGAAMPQIRQAYRKLALQYHPDRNPQPQAHEMFLHVQAAYDYLQQYFTLAAASPGIPLADTGPRKTQEELDWEKYQYVYSAPTNPQEYEAWARVAVKRARLQDEKDQAAYVQRMVAFKQKWWYLPAWIGSFLVMLLGIAIGIGIILMPFWLWISGYQKAKYIVLGCILSIIGGRILVMMKELRQDIRKYFGEDIEKGKE